MVFGMPPEQPTPSQTIEEQSTNHYTQIYIYVYIYMFMCLHVSFVLFLKLWIDEDVATCC